MSHVNTCAWKLVDPGKFTMGIEADRCGKIAVIKILRPSRKTDLFLCEHHINEFIEHWGLHYRIEILCDPGAVDPSNCIDPGCKKCLQDDPRTWRHG